MIDSQDVVFFRNANLAVRWIVFILLFWRIHTHTGPFFESSTPLFVPVAILLTHLILCTVLLFFSSYFSPEPILVLLDLLAGFMLALGYKGAEIFTLPYFLAIYAATQISWPFSLTTGGIVAALLLTRNGYSPGDIFQAHSILLASAGLLLGMTGVLKSRLSRAHEKIKGVISLMEFGQELGAALTYDNLFNLVFKVVNNVFQPSTCVIYLADDDKSMKLKAVNGPYVREFSNFHPDVAKTVLAEVILEKTPKAFFDFHAFPEGDEQIVPRVKLIRAGMAVPLVYEDEVKGLLFIAGAAPKLYNKELLKFFVALTNQIAVSLRNVELHEKTTTLAITDSVSGLFTHGHMQEILEREFLSAKYESRSLSNIILDVDHFKIINDQYGHPQGDALLHQLGGLIKSIVSNSEVVCRYGGDEFMIISPNTDRVHAVLVAERVRQIVEEHEFVLGSNIVHITLSGGVACFPEHAQTKKELIDIADQQLYQSKKAGRNRISFSKFQMTS